MSNVIFDRIKQRLIAVYGEEDAHHTFLEIKNLIEEFGIKQPVKTERWNQEDVVLITYGDTFKKEGEMPLQTLNNFLQNHVKDAVNTVHILPFFPYSSDDGFSVIDFFEVDHELGDWADIDQIAKNYQLMYDLVINHASRESLWFTDFKANIPPFNEFFIEVEGGEDISQVVRPRNTPLLVPAYTHRGRKMVWATFSADQIDLNFKNPRVLIKMLKVLLFYIQHKAHIVRLDAIAFLWKKFGTSSIHLPETHEITKLLRDVMELTVPDGIVLTETNVPHEENISYFGEQDEAHMVYQFSLAPLVLHALYRGDGQHLTNWAKNLKPLPKDCTYLNFIASHDGVGLRPVEGILPRPVVDDFIAGMHRQGGFVSMRRMPDGEDSPYEINISLFSALRETSSVHGADNWQIERFICSQLIMLTFQGVPAIYVHSLLATENDQLGVEQTGRTRSINRKKWDMNALQALLDNPTTPTHQVLTRLTGIMRERKKHQAFHPDIGQQVFAIERELFVIWRGLGEVEQPVLGLFNLTACARELDFTEYPDLYQASRQLRNQIWLNLLDQQEFDAHKPIELAPYQVVWLVPA